MTRGPLKRWEWRSIAREITLAIAFIVLLVVGYAETGRVSLFTLTASIAIVTLWGMAWPKPHPLDDGK